MTSTITSVEATAVRVPLDSPPSFAGRSVAARQYTLVRVRDSDGVQGVGFLHALVAGAGIAASAVRELLAPVLVGSDPSETERLWDAMYRETLLQGRAGVVLRAISAIDMALWDLNARRARLPLWRYLGASNQTSVPVYASGGYYLPGKGPDGLADEFAGYVAAGFDAMKMKVGRLSPGEDAERVAAARDAIGPDRLLMLDANNAWRNLPDALRAVQRFEPYQPAWIEEPFLPDDVDSHARLAVRTDIPVATGEIEGTRWRHAHLLERGAAGILQTDAGVCGGVTEFRRIASMAAGAGVTIWPHAFHHLHVHLVASAPNVERVEYFTDTSVVNFPVLVDSQPVVENGVMLLPERHGLGFDYLEDVVARHQMDPWS